MSDDRERRLAEAAQAARAAEERGDHWAANEAWARYELIRDAGRPASELLAETIALSEQTLELAESVGK